MKTEIRKKLEEISDNEFYLDMASECVDSDGNLIEEAFNAEGAMYLSDGLWVFPDGSIRKW